MARPARRSSLSDRRLTNSKENTSATSFVLSLLGRICESYLLHQQGARLCGWGQRALRSRGPFPCGQNSGSFTAVQGGSADPKNPRGHGVHVLASQGWSRRADLVLAPAALRSRFKAGVSPEAEELDALRAVSPEPAENLRKRPPIRNPVRAGKNQKSPPLGTASSSTQRRLDFTGSRLRSSR